MLRRIANVGKWKRGFMAINGDVTMGGGVGWGDDDGGGGGVLHDVAKSTMVSPYFSWVAVALLP